MKKNQISIFGLSAILGLSVMSCKKDEVKENISDSSPLLSTISGYSVPSQESTNNSNIVILNGVVGTLASEFNSSSLGSFFDNAQYRGAVDESNDWTSNWTISSDIDLAKANHTVPSEFDVHLMQNMVSKGFTIDPGATVHVMEDIRIPEGQTLTIGAGATLYFVAKKYLLIPRGAMINAIGNEYNPIVMTTDNVNADRGIWGGLIVNGTAPINEGLEAETEVVTGEMYGGNNSADNSGVLKYVRLEWSGDLVNSSKENNGLTLGGVGNGTEIDYVQVAFGQDDGYEWFGGTVNVKHLVSTGNADDAFDWTSGWTGNAQFLVVDQSADAGDNGFECDNNSNDFSAIPVSNPTLANVTVKGMHAKGMRLRAGTHVNLYNTVVTGGWADGGIVSETEETINSFTMNFEGEKSAFSTVKYASVTEGFME